jgi:hypothetical protein
MKTEAKHHRLGHGHGTAFLRETFQQFLEEHWQGDAPIPESTRADGETVKVKWLLGHLWHCTDELPGTYAKMLELQGRTTYAAAVRKVREQIAN